MTLRLCVRCRRVPITSAQMRKTGREATHCPKCLRARLRELAEQDGET